MRKKEFAEIFKRAIAEHARYIGVGIQTEGSSRPEIIINPTENFEEKLKYYRAAYDEDLILESAKGKKEIRIIAIAAGDSFADIEFLLTEGRPDWKKVISDAIDKVVNRMLSKYPDDEISRNVVKLIRFATKKSIPIFCMKKIFTIRTTEDIYGKAKL